MNAIQRIRGFERFGSVLGLERMEELMARLGNPQSGMKFIHVAGTNGKGSVCRFIYSMLEESGYKAGLFTSPYIQRFNERIEFNGSVIADADLEECADEVLARAGEMTAEGIDSPTEFEVITAIAFLYFKKKKAEYIVLEVGLGGRGDSTNIIEKPLISVITSVSYDHTDRLGNTLTEIAAEKAGIIKKGVSVVSNVAEHAAAGVIEAAARNSGCALYDVSKLKYGNVRKSLESYSFDADICGTAYTGVEITMLGEHQIKNALTALTAVEVLRKETGISTRNADLYSGLKNARQIGRFEILRKKPYFIIDGAHNEEGAKALKNVMRAHFPKGKVLMVAGILADKDVKGILKHFHEIADDFIATEPESDRRLTAERLCSELRSAGKNCIAALRPDSACEKASMLSGGYDAVLFAGSLYLLGKIRGIIDG